MHPNGKLTMYGIYITGDSRLIPLDQGAEVRQKVIHFRNIIDPVPANVITVGSFFHSKFVGKPKAPFIGPVRRLLAGKIKETFSFFCQKWMI